MCRALSGKRVRFPKANTKWLNLTRGIKGVFLYPRMHKFSSERQSGEMLLYVDRFAAG